jgi:hypothetical protein
MEYFCKVCNKQYKSRVGLWKHANTKHQNDTEKNSNNCIYCKKSFSCRQSKWRHEKTCIHSSFGNNLLEDINEIKQKLDNLESKPNIINYNTTNNTQNIIITASPGFESIDNFSTTEKKLIMNKGLASLMYLIEKTNFNKNLPENHSYCVTSLNDKHASIIDINTNSIIKADKIELYDKVLAGNLKKLEMFSTDQSFSKKEKVEYIETVGRLKNVLFNTKKGIKKYYNEINLLSYNNKDLILETWDGLKKLDEIIMKENFDKLTNNISQISEGNSSSDIESDDEVSSKKLLEFKKKFLSKKPIIELKESDYENDSDCGSESSDEVNEIVIKNKSYIVENNKLYCKNKNGTKGKVFGTYYNGVVKRLKEIEV